MGGSSEDSETNQCKEEIKRRGVFKSPVFFIYLHKQMIMNNKVYVDFDPKYREEVESGKYQVETLDGHQVRIICWDADKGFNLAIGPIIALVAAEGEDRPLIIEYEKDGKMFDYYEDGFSLRIKTDEDALSPVEEQLSNMLMDVAEHSREDLIEYYHPVILDAAKRELEVSEKAKYHEAYTKGFETGRSLHDEDITEAWKKGNDVGYADGKSDALMALPSWIYDPISDSETGELVAEPRIVPFDENRYNCDLYYNGFRINIAQLFQKLARVGTNPPKNN